MQRFTNQPLKTPAHLAVLGSSKVGNFVVITPLLRGLKAKYPACRLDYFGSDITQDFEHHCPYIDWRLSITGDRPDFLQRLASQVRQRCQQVGPYDLAINCDEFNEVNQAVLQTLQPRYLTGAGVSLNNVDLPEHSLDRRQSEYLQGTQSDIRQAILADQDWHSLAFLQRYQTFLDSNYISEIFCRLAYVETDFFHLEVPVQPPPFAVPNVLTQITATRTAKQWPLDHWLVIAQWCQQQQLSIGLIGSAPKLQQDLYHGHRLEAALLAQTQIIDLRGQTSLTQLAGALQRTKLCITLDTGPLHIATAVGCPTVAIFGNNIMGTGASPIRLWAPRQPHVQLALSSVNCQHCEANQFKNQHCFLDEHLCMQNVSPQQVINSVQALLNRE